jgi:hypothetical protein
MPLGQDSPTVRDANPVRRSRWTQSFDPELAHACAMYAGLARIWRAAHRSPSTLPRDFAKCGVPR